MLEIEVLQIKVPEIKVHSLRSLWNQSLQFCSFQFKKFYWLDSCLQFALHRLKSWAVNSCATSQRVQVLKLDRKIVESHMCLRLLRFSKSSYKLKHQVDKRIFAFLSLLASVNPLTGLLCYCWWSKLSHYSHSVTTYTLNKIFESAVAVGGLISLTGLCSSGQFISNS